MITNLSKIQKQLEENLKKLNKIGITPEMDEDDIDDLLLENKLREVDNDTYKLIKEIANYSSIYADAKDIENIEDIEAEAQKMLTAYDEYNIENAYNIFKNIFNIVTETEDKTLRSHTYTLNKEKYSYKLINRYLRTRGYEFASALIEDNMMTFTFFEDEGEYPSLTKFTKIAETFPISAEENETYKNIQKQGNTFTIEGWYNYNTNDLLRELRRLNYEFIDYYEDMNLVLKFEEHDLDAEDLFDFSIEYHHPSTENPCLDFKERYEDEIRSEHLFNILQEINEAKWNVTDYHHSKFMEAINKCFLDYVDRGMHYVSDFDYGNVLNYYYDIEGDEDE